VATFSEHAANTGKVVIVAALDTTCVRTMFETIVQLMPKCEKVKKLQAICKGCNHQASFHIRTAPKHVTQMIGGEDMYKPMCRECYHKVAKEIEEQEALQLALDKQTLLTSPAQGDDTNVTLRQQQLQTPEKAI
jgi:thymidine kinase